MGICFGGAVMLMLDGSEMKSRRALFSVSQLRHHLRCRCTQTQSTQNPCKLSPNRSALGMISANQTALNGDGQLPIPLCLTRKTGGARAVEVRGGLVQRRSSERRDARVLAQTELLQPRDAIARDCLQCRREEAQHAAVAQLVLVQAEHLKMGRRTQRQSVLHDKHKSHAEIRCSFTTHRQLLVGENRLAERVANAVGDVVPAEVQLPEALVVAERFEERRGTDAADLALLQHKLLEFAESVAKRTCERNERAYAERDVAQHERHDARARRIQEMAELDGVRDVQRRVVEDELLGRTLAAAVHPVDDLLDQMAGSAAPTAVAKNAGRELEKLAQLQVAERESAAGTQANSCELLARIQLSSSAMRPGAIVPVRELADSALANLVQQRVVQQRRHLGSLDGETHRN